jgi:hypothetical protein
MPREIDEDLIEATIRRIAESKAADRAEPLIELPVAEAVAPEFPAKSEPPGSLGESGSPYEPVTSTPELVSPYEPVAAMPEPAMSPQASAATAPTAGEEEQDPVAVILARLDSLSEQIGALHQQVAIIAGALGPLTAPSRAGGGAPYGAPNVVSMPQRQGTPPGSRAATAEQLEPQVIDRRPIPKPLPPIEVEPRRGLDLLPRTYRITVEDKRRGVDLVPLHRALLSMDGVRDMALLSYNNGVAIVSLEMAGELDPDALAHSVSEAMSREARTEVHNEHTMVVKLAGD